MHVAVGMLGDPASVDGVVAIDDPNQHHDVGDEVRKLKDEIEGDILVAGSGQLIQTLLDEGLIDEWRLMIFPIIVGDGKHLFDAQRGMTELRLKDSKAIGPDGIILLTYVPA